MSYLRCRLYFLIVFFCLTSLLPPPLSAKDWQWTVEDRVIAVSDIHGAYDEFLTLLQGLQLVDDKGHWTGGKDHLVIVGDVLDRGAASRDVLTLIKQLETDAAVAGGMVHLILGNHEIMNLVGDLRYVEVDEYAGYIDVEDPEHRSSELQRFTSRRQGGELDEVALQESFKLTYPPGFFGHRKMFSLAGELGKWLLTRPAIIKINDSVFVHGGLSPSMKGRSLTEINHRHHEALQNYLSSMEYFQSKDVLELATNFFDQPHLIKQSLEAGDAEDAASTESTVSAEDLEQAKQLFTAYRSEVFDGESPTWYRGNVGCSVAIERDRLQELLGSLGARRLVIGHTSTVSRRIESRFDGMLLRVDTGMLTSYYQGQPAAAIIGSGGVTAYYVRHPGDTSITPQELYLGPKSARLTDTELERVLATAPILSTEPGEDKTIRVTIDHEGHPIETLFTAARSKRRSAAIIPEVAAYRLDRHLGMEMIPVAVVRTVDGKNGVMTLDIADLVDEDQRILRQLGSSAWCPLKDQFNMMYVFDILLHNKGRERNSMRYRADDMRLMLTENRNILGAERGIPRYLKSVAVSIPADLRSKFQAMNAQMLEELLGDVLDVKRRKAILSRRDALLKKSN